MKKILLAGSAAIALAALSGAAAAQEIKTGNLSLKIEGSLQFLAGYVDQDNETATRDTEFSTDSEVEFTFTGKSDNGLTYGANVELEADPGNTNVADEVYGFASGSFGKVEFGNEDGAADKVRTGMAYDFAAGGLDGQDNWKFFTGALASTPASVFFDYNIYDSSDSTKVSYYTPSFAGITAGISYIPKLGGASEGQAVSRSDLVGTFEDGYEIGLTYAGEFSGVGVKAGANYVGASTVANGFEDLKAWQVAASVSYAGFTLGGAYIDNGKMYGSGAPIAKSAADDDHFRIYNVGLQYATGPVIAGVQYQHSKAEGLLGNINGTDVDGDVWVVGATYKIAPGFAVFGEATFAEVDDEIPASDAKGNVFILGSTISF